MTTFVLSVCILLNFNTYAVNSTEQEAEEPAAASTTRNIDINVEPGKLLISDAAMPLEAGETISVRVSYTPSSADMRFGLVTVEGHFYSLPGEKGLFDLNIKISESGQYYFAIQNNSSLDVIALGFVIY